MYNHAPKSYNCPICLAIKGIESEDTMIKQEDIFYRDTLVIALVSSKFVGNNPGHVIIVPIKHFENIYDLPTKESGQIMKVAKELAIAMKKIRKCSGVTFLQNNEPASDQHAFHYHLHVFPRFDNDQLHANLGNTWVSSPEERKQYSYPLKRYFKTLP